MFKNKEDQYNRIFQLFERVENPYKPLLLEYDGGRTGFRDKWFDATTGNLYEDKTKTTELKTFKIIANATDEVRAIGRVARGRNYWIVQLGSETFLFIVDPCGDEDCDETEETKNLKEGSGVVDMIYNIYVK